MKVDGGSLGGAHIESVCCVTASRLFQPLCTAHSCDRQTDRQTDRPFTASVMRSNNPHLAVLAGKL